MEASVSNLEKMVSSLSDTALNMGLRILAAIVIYFVGKFIIGKLVKGVSKLKSFERIDETARVYIINFIKAVLYTVLIVCIVAQLGVAMSSVVALLATAGAAIGLALQGSLANFAGGLMLLIFRPFRVGDFIVAGEHKGTVQSISLVYTTLLTFDNATVMIPNGSLMNSNIVNATAEPTRRVDLSFDISGAEPSDKVRSVILDTVGKYSQVLSDPAPAVAASGTVTDGITYAVRTWVNTADYWTVYEGLTEDIPAALNEAGIKRPTMPVRIADENK